MNDNEKISFWNHKILPWESARYLNKKKAAPALQRRLEFAAQFLKTQAIGKTVLDLGCGSGLLFSRLNANQFKFLIGLDFSDVAIARAKETHLAPNVRFICGRLSEAPWDEADCIVALGLTDWLGADELDLLLGQLGDKKVLISFSDRDRRWGRWIHQLFIFITYGWRSRGYVPKYYSGLQLKQKLESQGTRGIEIKSGTGLNIVSYLVKV